jgi:hypothetical protein
MPGGPGVRRSVEPLRDALTRQLNYDLLDFIEADLVAPAIVELRRARRGRFAIAAAFLSVPPFRKLAVIPVAEAVVAELGCDGLLRRAGRIIAWAFACGSSVRVSLRVPRPIVRNNGPLGSPRSSAPSR